MILLQEGEAVAGSEDDFPACRLQLSGKDLQERRLPGSVGSDQAIAVPFGKLDVHIFKQRFFPNA